MTIEEKKEEMNKRIKKMLNENELAYDKGIGLSTSYHTDRLLRDRLNRRDVLCTSFIHPLFRHMHIVYADAETLELLYVQTRPTSFVDIDTYFRNRK
jgi:hypothetical protein